MQTCQGLQCLGVYHPMIRVAPYRTPKVIDNGKQGQSKLTFTVLGDSRDKGVLLTTESYGLTEGCHS
jgi:hypothetical protein